jgi:hypothetical protein
MRRSLACLLFAALLAVGLSAPVDAAAPARRVSLLAIMKHDDERAAAEVRAATVEEAFIRGRLGQAGGEAALLEALPALDAWLVHVPAPAAGAALDALRAATRGDGPLAFVEAHGTASLPPPRPATGAAGDDSPAAGLALAIIDLGADGTHPLLREALGRLHYQAGAPGADGSARLLRSHGTAMAGIYAQLARGHALSVGGVVLPWTRLDGGLAIAQTQIARAGPETRAGRNEFLRALDWLMTPAAGRARPDLVNYSQGNGRLCASASACEEHAWSGVTRIVDRLVDEGVLFVKSAGNRGHAAFNSMTAPGDSWNGLSVGNMHAFDWSSCTPSAARERHKVYATSSVGPTAGRRLPDLVAPGVRVTTTGVDPAWCRTQCRDGGATPCAFCRRLGSPDPARGGHWKTNSGTSPAAAVVGAVALRLRQDGVRDPRLVKAVLINSAETWHSGGAPHPGTRGDGRGCAADTVAARHRPWAYGAHHDRSYGWGYVDPQRARAEAGHATLGRIAAGQAVCYRTRLEPWHKLTLTWHRHARVCAHCDGYPALAQLALELLSDDASPRLLDRDTRRTTLDNVVQVSNGRGPEARPRARVVIARVRSAAAQDEETYALASPRALERLPHCPPSPAGPPRLPLAEAAGSRLDTAPRLP